MKIVVVELQNARSECHEWTWNHFNALKLSVIVCFSFIKLSIKRRKREKSHPRESWTSSVSVERSVSGNTLLF